MAQLTFGLMSGVEKVKPFAVGDIVVRVTGNETRRYVVQELAPETYVRPALVCISLDNGNTAILFEDEVTYRSR